ncbi:MAG: heavy metal-associated domain-containing protein [Gammaproteobacteria bacterium]
MQQTTLKVTGMTCQHCVAAVTKALQQVPGVTTADVSLKQGQATIDGSADPAALLAAVKEEGYSAELKD